MSDANSAVIAAQKSELALCEQLSEWESLPYGVAFWSAEYPKAPEANQLRDVWLADVDGDTAFEKAEAYFAAKGVACGRWTAASGQNVEPVARALTSRGWVRRVSTVWGLSSWDWLEFVPNDAIRVLPARAMPKAFRATFEDGSADAKGRSDLAGERLNDSRLDVFVAVHDSAPAGRIGYLQVGDIARVTELTVLPGLRHRGVAKALATHVLQLARRLLPREIVACSDQEDESAAGFLRRMGFGEAGRMECFERTA